MPDNTKSLTPAFTWKAEKSTPRLKAPPSEPNCKSSNWDTKSVPKLTVTPDFGMYENLSKPPPSLKFAKLITWDADQGVYVNVY